ncbi:hypothetical protein [Tropicimonas sp. IMCC6043]|uniref:hypothetical protein n=1 Tax=Tropicimonas sp. IMCC6043 TaxID=2510645 RepID=UPI0010D40B16|nr:hypothetical protein [Tropicimonas sp. IMCC6043]RYH07610.1 hypothetical protein EU800_19610 [Tropicimonas sp. IMCC6043]
MAFNALPRWLPVAVLCALGVYAYLRFIEDPIGAAFFGFFSAIVVYRMATCDVPFSEAMANDDDFTDQITVQGGVVHFDDGQDDWSEPVRNFDGVLWRVERAARDKTGIWNILMLVHRTDPKRTITLYRSQSDYGMRRRWSEMALALDLPALRDTGNGKVTRLEVEDLTRSARERARQGRMAYFFDLQQEVPKGLTWWHADGMVSVVIRKSRWPFLLSLLPVLFLTVMLPNDPPVVKLVIVGGPAAILLVWMAVDYRIEMTPEHMIMRRTLGVLALPGRRYPLDAIMEVLKFDDIVASVRVETDRNVMKIRPLSPKNAEWLHGFLTSALANAPEPATVE